MVESFENVLLSTAGLQRFLLWDNQLTGTLPDDLALLTSLDEFAVGLQRDHPAHPCPYVRDDLVICLFGGYSPFNVVFWCLKAHLEDQK